jgi:hypothetical protein
MPSMMNQDGEFPAQFQHDRMSLQYGICMRRWLDQQFPGHWTGRHGSLQWPPRSPNLTILDFYLWRHLKAMVYQVKIQNIKHLNDCIRDARAGITPEV